VLKAARLAANPPAAFAPGLLAKSVSVRNPAFFNFFQFIFLRRKRQS
jgi:hypothetical protein